jgi:hypothetical protein
MKILLGRKETVKKNWLKKKMAEKKIGREKNWPEKNGQNICLPYLPCCAILKKKILKKKHIFSFIY